MAHYVQQHAKDISIRLALGGSPRGVLALMVGRGMALVAAGIAVGVAGAAALARLMGAFLYGVAPLDPTIFGAAVVGLALIAALACWIPAVRAAGLEPGSVLRSE